MKKIQFLGFSLIILSWIFWAFIFVIPFLELEAKYKATAMSVLFIATNIFWIGALLAGKELMTKLRIWPKYKIWVEKRFVKSQKFNQNP